MTDLSTLDLRQYCALNRARFYIDPDSDAQWFFGNLEVERELLARIESDLDIRGVPKCGVVGRFGIGKTHTLNHVKWLVEKHPEAYPLLPIVMDVVWDESNRELSRWHAVHIRILDALGEAFLRTIVREFDAQGENRQQELSEGIRAIFHFGDENLRQSLAVILADYFKREARSTAPAWQWLKAEKGVRLEPLGANKAIEDAGDMVSTILNVGCLCRAATGKGILLLMDEAQSLGNVVKADAEVHRAFLKLADADNGDVGFVLAVFGGGTGQIPKVLTNPEDILSRMGVTRTTINTAFIELQRVLRTELELRDFLSAVLEALVDADAAQALIDEFGIVDVRRDHFPFTEAALDRLAEVLHAREENRNPRQAIDALAKCCSRAYRAGRGTNTYCPVTTALASEVMQDF